MLCFLIENKNNINMKVKVARASSLPIERTVDMHWAGQFCDELLKLNRQIPIEEYAKDVSWEKEADVEYSYVVSVNSKNRTVEVMIYDYYVE